MDAPIVRSTNLTLQQVLDIAGPEQAWISNVHDGIVSLHFENDDGFDYVEDIPENSEFLMKLEFDEKDRATIWIDPVPNDWPFEPRKEEDLFREAVYEAILNGGDTGCHTG